MRIDVLDKAHFRIFEDNLNKALAQIHNELMTIKSDMKQLQDRIKILESANDSM